MRRPRSIAVLRLLTIVLLLEDDWALGRRKNGRVVPLVGRTSCRGTVERNPCKALHWNAAAETATRNSRALNFIIILILMQSARSMVCFDRARTSCIATTPQLKSGSSLAITKEEMMITKISRGRWLQSSLIFLPSPVLITPTTFNLLARCTSFVRRYYVDRYAAEPACITSLFA